MHQKGARKKLTWIWPSFGVEKSLYDFLHMLELLLWLLLARKCTHCVQILVLQLQNQLNTLLVNETHLRSEW